MAQKMRVCVPRHGRARLENKTTKNALFPPTRFVHVRPEPVSANDRFSRRNGIAQTSPFRFVTKNAPEPSLSIASITPRMLPSPARHASVSQYRLQLVLSLSWQMIENTGRNAVLFEHCAPARPPTSRAHHPPWCECACCEKTVSCSAFDFIVLSRAWLGKRSVFTGKWRN